MEETLSRAILWQAGFSDLQQQIIFLAGTGELGGGNVNIMGSHAGVCKWLYAKRLESMKGDDGALEDRFVGFNMQTLEIPLSLEMAGVVEGRLRNLFRHSNPYGFNEQNHLEHLYISERTRRWESGGHYGQPGQIVSPFFNPDIFHAALAYPRNKRHGTPMQDHIVRRNWPAWSVVPYRTDLVLREKMERKMRPTGLRKIIHSLEKRLRAVVPSRAARWRQSTGSRDFDRRIYWNEIGAPLIKEAFESGGLWTRILDVDQAGRMWNARNLHHADLIAVMYLVEKRLREE